MLDIAPSQILQFGVYAIAGLRTATAAAVRAWATSKSFTVPASNVLVQTYQTA